MGSLTCAAHYAQLASGLCYPGTAAQELSSGLFSLPFDQFLVNATENILLNDPWPLLSYPTYWQHKGMTLSIPHCIPTEYTQLN